MATYQSDDISIAAPAQRVFDKLSDLQGLKQMLENAPADALDAEKAEQLRSIEVTADTISVPAGPVGKMTLRVTRREAPSLIRLEGEGSPVPMHVELRIRPVTESTCQAKAIIDIDIPMMLRPMVNGPLTKMAQQFGQMLGHINYSDPA